MQFGNFEIFSIVENNFQVDGGAMYGVIPKVIWQRFNPPDADNMLRLDINLLLVKAGGKNILIDAGIGDTLSEKQKKIFGIQRESALEKELSAQGLSPSDIDMVILTHLHADHAGGVITLDKNQTKVPRFPHARHVVQTIEWEDAMHPDERTSATYFTLNLKILEEKNLLQLVEGNVEIAKGIKVINTGGHTPGHQAVLIGDGEFKIIFAGDVIPTTYHLKIPYVASVDLCPRETMEQKRKFLQMCINDGWALAFDHDLKMKIGKLEKVGEEITLEAISSQS
jgi:glyoxylase-like metal-dependent hydrolase (beta-lactamase superfamily II)